MMPFQNNSFQQPQSNPPYPHDKYYGPVNALYQAGPTLGSVGAPASQWSSNKSGTTEEPVYTGSNTNGLGVAEQRLALRTGPPAYAAQPGLPATPRRPTTFGRPTEELHIPQSGNTMDDVQHYGAPPAYGGEAITMNIQPSTPQHPTHASSVASNPLPGSLQPGMTNRPGPLSSNTAPTVPTLPQISTQVQQSQRPLPLSASHSYSRSSPGNMDQTKYKPFSNTPETQKYASPASSYMPQTPQGAPSSSPLGLADIRPRTDIGLSDGPLSPGLVSENDPLQYPSNSSYVAPWPIYAIDWCKWPPRSSGGSLGKIAMGSYLEDNHNYLQVLEARKASPDPDSHADRGLEFIKTAEASHSYPVTRILWEPPSSNKQTTDLLATSGDHLRLWSLPTDTGNYASNSINRPADQPVQKLTPLALLSNSKSPEHTAPITSLDWNVVSPSLIITSSIDTTCTIWDIPTLTAKTQLIAHDKEVYDVRFCASSVDVFVSCGADGSVRMFDLRSLEHSTIIYEPSDKQEKNTHIHSPDTTSPSRGQGSSLTFPPPLLRIATSPHDAHLLATFSQDSSIIRVLDVRQPGQALLELKGHGATVNCIEWCSSQRGVLASGADDCCVLVWDLLGSSAATTSSTSSAPNLTVGGTSAGAGVNSGGGHGNSGGSGSGTSQERGPTAAWECGFEVSNLSWAPTSACLGVVAGKGLWGVQM